MQTSDENVLLFSGGLDSTALAVSLRPAQTLTINYGQLTAQGEIRAAAAISGRLGIEHHVINADCASIGSGLLSGRDADSAAPVEEWWPFRNQLLLTLGAAWALPRGIRELVVGSVSTDSAHADGREDFFKAMDEVISLQEGGLRVRAPALPHTTADLMRQARVPDGIVGFTHSCHVAEFACGLCPGCIKRAEVLEELGRA